MLPAVRLCHGLRHGRRRTYRIRSDDWAAFLAHYTGRTDDLGWE